MLKYFEVQIAHDLRLTSRHHYKEDFSTSPPWRIRTKWHFKNNPRKIPQVVGFFFVILAKRGSVSIRRNGTDSRKREWWVRISDGHVRRHHLTWVLPSWVLHHLRDRRNSRSSKWFPYRSLPHLISYHDLRDYRRVILTYMYKLKNTMGVFYINISFLSRRLLSFSQIGDD